MYLFLSLTALLLSSVQILSCSGLYTLSMGCGAGVHLGLQVTTVRQRLTSATPILAETMDFVEAEREATLVNVMKTTLVCFYPCLISDVSNIVQLRKVSLLLSQ